MDGRFSNPYGNKQVEPGITSEFPFSGVVSRGKITSTASAKRSRRGVHKRVVSIPIGDVHGSRLKGDGAPPSDSWAWRKYGQKPIKGSPYPRGYYRCSSSKGCPARKQVERSRVDPTMLVVTYACEHNHPGPASRNPNKAKPTSQTQQPEVEEPAIFSTEPEEKFTDLADDSLIIADDFRWFSDASVAASASSSHFSLLDSPVCGGSNSSGTDDADLTMIFPLGEEDESLFADLGELPECSVVFRRGCVEEQEERRRCTLKAG